MSIEQRWILIAITIVTVLFLYLLGSVLTPFMISIVLAYLGNPLVLRLELLGVSRTLSVSVVFFVLALVIITLLLVVIPLVFQQLKSLIQLLPDLGIWLQANVWPLLQKYLNVNSSLFDLNHIATVLTAKWQKTGGLIALLSSSATRSSIALFNFLANLFLIPVVTFYLLRDWKRLISHLRSLLPRRIEPKAMILAKECDGVLGAFLKGQLMVMLSLGLIYSVGLGLIGLKFAILIGLLAGLVSIIPYMGFIVGFSMALITALFQPDNNWLLVGVASVFIVGQALEGGFLTPNLVGDSLGLHPVAVIFSLMAGGQLFGIVGMLIALPLAAVIVVFLRHFHRNYKESLFYHAKSHE
ncbi:MAG: AI-2E family transporter [Endozoicomonas sp. (ex Botrylloides leachii)]|nr:AI-2E family transporter [Endozoicomonas sp. (ex Botrylloides leachii)]